MTREFPFLPDLPKANLDDRKFDDLVHECRLRIPRYCPEWTNYNPGDPGITLVELFAWLTDQMLMRFNQVPRRYYVAFLELLGIRLQPPTAAQVDLVFNLSKAQSQPKLIPEGTEVATVRTPTEPAVVFTTDRPLVIGCPRIVGLFTLGKKCEHGPDDRLLAPEPLANQYGNPNESLGRGEGLLLFANIESDTESDIESDSCFYLVLSSPAEEGVSSSATPPGSTSTFPTGSDSGDNASSANPAKNSITGNIIAINFRGRIAETTGINPNKPPLVWEVWHNGKWQAIILRRPEDDKTRGFSFHGQKGIASRNGTGQVTDQGEADVILHLPSDVPSVDFGTSYQGHWIRCIYKKALTNSSEGYQNSPIITQITTRAIGGKVSATECIRLKDELLGISNGKPGQTFQLQGYPVLPRQPGEHIWMRLPSGEERTWEEVENFGDSEVDHRHYLIDSQSGTVQFGPLVREPSYLRTKTYQQAKLQPWGKKNPPGSDSLSPVYEENSSEQEYRANDQEKQYGKVPPLGAEIYMSAYRVGGGSRGNVKAGKLSVLKIAIPYVKEVTNYDTAEGGKEAESLEQAVLRVPQILRTSKTAVVPEDFENIALRTHSSIYRAHCPAKSDMVGVVKLLIVLRPNSVSSTQPHGSSGDTFKGMAPDSCFSLSKLEPDIREQLETNLNHHKTLGVQIRLDTPDYVGAKVRAEILLRPENNSQSQQNHIAHQLKAALYRFISPITGGFDRNGWPIGQPLYASDIIPVLQNFPEVSLVGKVELFGIRNFASQGWHCSELADYMVDPGEMGLLCSWEDAKLGSGHEFVFISPQV
jgi:predicted phage baseplate assembly protein